MSCREISFSHATCRIDVAEATSDPLQPAYAATMSVVEEKDGQRVERPLLFEDGTPARIHGSSEPLTVSTAITYLEGQFGALSATEHICEGDFSAGPPVVVRE